MSMNQSVTLGVLVGPQALTSFGDLKDSVTLLWQTRSTKWAGLGRHTISHNLPKLSEWPPCWGLAGNQRGTVASQLVMAEDLAKGHGFRKAMKEMVLGSELEPGT